MALNNNSPTFTWVNWNGVFVTLDGTTYPIKDDSTNHKYIFWDKEFPYVFKTTQVLPEQSLTTFLVAVNKSGVADKVPQRELVINWDGQMDVDLSGINNSIGAMQDQITDLDGKVTTKFVGIETDLNGIRTRVSKVEESASETKTEVANLWIKSNEIGSRVEEVNTKLDTTNSELNDFKNDVMQDFIDVSTGLGNFNDYIHDAFKDNVISESEAILIKEHLLTLDKEKMDVIRRADYILDNPAVVDPERALLVKSKDEYNVAHKNLADVINTVIADGKIIPSERTLVTTAFAQYNLKLSNLKSAIQKVTDIGVVEKIETAKSEVIQTAHEITSTVSKKVDDLEDSVNEEFSQIKQTSNSVNIRVETIEKNYSTNEAMQQAVADAKSEILEQVTDIGSVVEAVQDYIDNAFKDKLLDETFINKLKDLKLELAKEKSDIDDIVGKISNNSYVSPSILKLLNGKKQIFDNCHNVLLDEIEKVILDGAISSEENNSINLKTQEYNFSIVELQKVINTALDDISTNKMNSAISHTDTQVGEVNSALNDLGGYLDGAFKDGVLDEIEKATLKEKIDTLTLEKKDVDEQVSQILKNVILSDGVRRLLMLSKASYDISHSQLVSYIESLINSDSVSDDDMKQLKILFDEYILKLGDIKKHIQIAIEDIAKQSVDNAKQELSGQIGEVDNALGNLNDYLEGGFKNGVITEAEKLTIKQQLNTLDVEKKDVDGHYEQIIKSSALDQNLKSQLIAAKSGFDVAHRSLIETINTMIEDSNLDNAEREKFNNAYKVYGDRLKVLNSLMQQALEQIPNYLVERAKSELRGEISDVSNAIGSLEESMNGAFKDGIIDETEAKALGQQVMTLENEMQDLLGKYEELKKNSDLNSQELNRLESTWTAYSTAHRNLKNKITTVSNSGIVTPEDTVAINQLLEDYRVKLKTLGSVFERCVDEIAKKKAEDAKGEAIEYTKSEIQVVKGEISLKVEKTEMDTAIGGAVNSAKNELQTKIDEAKKATVDLENVMNGAFKDGIIDETELKAIQSSISQLDKEKESIDSQYAQIYNNKDLE